MELSSLNLMQAAVELAETRNYSRAARRLGIQQPTLTKRILELEHVLGFPLFLRSTQFVEPTDACKLFVEEAKKSIFHAERAMHVARVAVCGAQLVLHVGRSQYTDPYLVSTIAAVTLPLYTNLKICMTSMTSNELETEVLLGKLDLAITSQGTDETKLTRLELTRTPLYLAMPEDNALSGEYAIPFSALHQRRWILFARHIHSAMYDRIMNCTREAGVVPAAVHHVVTAEEAAQELYAGVGDVAILTRAGAWRIARNGIAMRPFSDEPFVVSSTLIARANDESRLVSEFTRTLKRKLEARMRSQLSLPLAGRGSGSTS